MRQRGGGNDCRIGNAHTVVLLIFVLQAAQNRNGVFHAWLGHIDRLEAAGEGGIFLDMLLVFVERRCADTMQFAARQRRLEQIGSVHRTVRLASAHQRMHLVDEKDDAAVGGCDLLQHRLQPLFEFAAIFSARDHRAEIEREQALVLKALGHITIDDAQRETFDDRGLADPRLADQDRVVLGPARQHLNGAADFLVAADYGIKLAVARHLREIAGIFLQRVISVLGRGGIGGAALAQRVDGRIQILWRDTRFREYLSCFAVLLQRQCEQQPFDSNETVSGLLTGFFGGVENARQRRIKIDLAGAGAADLRPLGERCFHRLQCLTGLAARAIDQPSRKTLGIIEQNLEQVFGGKLLVAFAQGQ